MKLRDAMWKAMHYYFCKLSIIFIFLQNKFLFKKNVLFVFCVCFPHQGFSNHFIHHILKFESQDVTFLRHFYQLSVPAYFGISFPACYNFRACSFSVPYRFHFNFSCRSSFCSPFVLCLITGVKPRARSTKVEMRGSGSVAPCHHLEACWCWSGESHGGPLSPLPKVAGEPTLSSPLSSYSDLLTCSFFTVEFIFRSPDSPTP